MIESLDDFLLTVKDSSGTKYFEADEAGIKNLKIRFAYESDDFLWLRKGEDVGAAELASFLGSINSLVDPALLSALGGYYLVSRAIEQARKDLKGFSDVMSRAAARMKGRVEGTRKPRQLRILCWPNDDTEEARPVYEAQGYEVKHYANRDCVGFHRFYLSDKAFCLFLRVPGNRFMGFLGDDRRIRENLKELFENEWRTARQPSPAA